MLGGRLLGFLVSMACLAQAPGPIQITVNEVIVPVTVTDEKGRFVTDLDVADFKIYEDGK